MSFDFLSEKEVRPITAQQSCCIIRNFNAQLLEVEPTTEVS